MGLFVELDWIRGQKMYLNTNERKIPHTFTRKKKKRKENEKRPQNAFKF